MWDNNMILFVLTSVVILIHISDIHMQPGKREILHNFMLGTDLLAAYLLGTQYIKTNNVLYLLPVLIGVYCFLIVGYNKGQDEGGDTPWAIMNGTILGITAMSLKPVVL